MKNKDIILHSGTTKLLVNRTNAMFFYETFIAGEYDEIRLRKGDIVLDAGANIGDFTVKAAKIVGKKGKVIAIEPNDALIPLLRRNININNLNNVTVVQCALSDIDGEVPMIFKGDTIMMSDSRDSIYIDVESRTVDSIAREFGFDSFDVIKMDIEGAEYSALSCMKDLGSVREAIVELHGEDNMYKVAKLLTENGFDVKSFSNLRLMRNVLCNVLRHLPSFLGAEIKCGALATRAAIYTLRSGQNPLPPLNDSGYFSVIYATNTGASTGKDN